MPQVLFDDEVKQDNHPARDDTHVNDRGSHIKKNNDKSNLNHGDTAEDITELHVQENVNNKGPAPKNIAPHTVMTPKLGWLEDLRTCSQKADTNATNRKGTFVLKTWAQIGNMDVLSMFHLCFPEKYVINELIPTTNRNIKGGVLTLSEFYVVLG